MPTDIPTPLIWEVKPDGIWIWKDGAHVGTVPRDRLPGLILDAATILRVPDSSL